MSVEGITIPDDKVELITDEITDFAINLMGRYLPHDEASEGFGEPFREMVLEQVRSYSFSRVSKEMGE